MTIYPVEDHYQAPPEDPANPDETTSIPLPEAGEELRIRQRIRGDRTVDFAVVQITGVGADKAEVFRIDCDHGFIHSHQFALGRAEALWDHRMIEEIPVGDSNFVDRWLPIVIDMVEAEWAENLRRWRDGNSN